MYRFDKQLYYRHNKTLYLQASGLDADNQTRYKDFLDIILDARDETGRGLTDIEIRDEVDVFMFGGKSLNITFQLIIS